MDPLADDTVRRTAWLASDVRDDFPSHRALESAPLQAVLPKRGVDRRWRVHEHAERAPTGAHEQIYRSHAKPHPPHVAGIHSAKQPPCFFRGGADQCLHSRLAAAHAIEGHDVRLGYRRRDLDQITVDEAHTITVTPPNRLLLRGLDVVG